LFEKEVWRDVVGYEGLYEVSSFGRVKALDRLKADGTFLRGGIKKLRVNNNGYSEIALTNYEFKGKEHRIHRLVAEAFIPNPENKPFVNHIDGIKVNNHVINLEWVTPKENSRHARKVGLLDNSGENNHNSTLTESQVRKIREMHEWNGFRQSELSKIFNVPTGTMNHILKYRTWKNVYID